jgi:hypothetical protein
MRSASAWALTIAGFALGIGLQLLLYGGQLWGGGPVWNLGDDPFWEAFYLPLVLLFLFAPAATGLTTAAASLGRVHRTSGRPPPPWVVVALLGLALLSSYAGVLIAFNTWGT